MKTLNSSLNPVVSSDNFFTRSLCVALGLGSMMVVAGSTQAGITLQAGSFESFPSNAEFQTFDPHNISTPAAAERTLTTTRFLSQTFQLGSDVTVTNINLMFARGMSGNVGELRIFSVADALAGDITADYNAAVSGGFLADFQFTMPAGLDPAGLQQQLQIDLSGTDVFTLLATTGSAGYALALSVVDGTSEVLTWRFGDPGTGSGTGWYANGRVYYDDFISSGSTETRRDGLFALNNPNAVVPEPTSLAMLGIGLAGLALTQRLRRR